jgi:O-antigen ligase
MAWLLLAMSTIHTKMGGLLWVILCLWAFWLALRKPAQARTPSRGAALRWLAACSITLTCWLLMSIYWKEPCCTPSPELNAGLRLWLGAIAAFLWTQYWQAQPEWHRRITQGLAMACIASLVMVVVLDRGRLPSHPIPWSAAVAMVLVLLLPQALGTKNTPQRQWRLFCCGLGLAAVLLSQSRGSYLVLGWMVYVWVASSTPTHRRVKLMQITIASAAVAAAIGLTSALPSDPLRIREGWHDWNSARQTENHNSSLGARLALYELAIETIAESPWVGVGASERLRRIHSLGQNLPEPASSQLAHARTQGHVHNGYLHSAMDGGIIGLVGFLVLIGGLLYAAKALWHSHAIARQQMLGLAFVHATTSLSNVNLAHNYYAVMLSLCTMLVIIQASAQAPSN